MNIKKSIESLIQRSRRNRTTPKNRQRTSAPARKGGPFDFKYWGDRLAFSWKVREGLYKHLSAQVSNGVPVEVAIENYRSRLKRRKKASSDKIVADVVRRMRDGATLASALGKWIPQDETSIINSGELSGNLPKSLDLVVESRRRISKVNKALKSAMVTPVIYLGLVYGMLWAIGRFVTPQLEMGLSKERANGLASVLYSAGDFANSWYVLIPPTMLAIVIFLIVRSLPNWTGRRRIAAEKYFPYSFYRDIQGYTWLMGFVALLRAGMADVEILKKQTVQASPWLKERLHALWLRMDNGSSLPRALLASGKNKMPPFAFPNPDVIDDISSMAGFPDFSERISVLAVQWADELEEATRVNAQRFGFAMEVAMYGIMGFLLAAINSMSTQVGSAPGM